MADVTARRGERTVLRRVGVLAVAVALALLRITTAQTADPEPDAAGSLASAAGDGDLPRLNVTGNYVTGISSGGYMATQLQIAYSSRFRGAGVFSAGPYYCALGSATIALWSRAPPTTCPPLQPGVTLLGHRGQEGPDGLEVVAGQLPAGDRAWFKRES